MDKTTARYEKRWRLSRLKKIRFLKRDIKADLSKLNAEEAELKKEVLKLNQALFKLKVHKPFPDEEELEEDGS